MLVRIESLPLGESMPRDFVDDLFGGWLAGNWFPQRTAFPALDLAESSRELVVMAELPGVKKEDVRVTLQDGVLNISGERHQKTLPEESRWHRTEVESGKFHRSVELPTAVDESAVSAELKDGILRIVVPKAEEVRPREIKVK
jgi:HSP20 family protein